MSLVSINNLSKFGLNLVVNMPCAALTTTDMRSILQCHLLGSAVCKTSHCCKLFRMLPSRQRDHTLARLHVFKHTIAWPSNAITAPTFWMLNLEGNVGCDEQLSCVSTCMIQCMAWNHDGCLTGLSTVLISTIQVVSLSAPRPSASPHSDVVKRNQGSDALTCVGYHVPIAYKGLIAWVWAYCYNRS